MAETEVPLVAMTAQRRVELIEQREFLLRSLVDLEREHEAGDIDEADYRELKDGYTARAAAIVRELDADEVAAPPRPRSVDWLRVVASTIGLVAAVAVVAWLLAASSAQRLPDQSMTGADPRSERELLLAQARAAQFQDPMSAAANYALVLDKYPEDTEALTYGAWTRVLAAKTAANGDVETQLAEYKAAIGMMTQAIEIDPEYPDPYCLRGVVVGRFIGLPGEARDDLQFCVDHNPPQEVAGLVQGLLDEANAQAMTTPPG